MKCNIHKRNQSICASQQTNSAGDLSSINMLAQNFRASKTFTTLVVCVSIFTDILLQNLIVPVLPYALSERVGLSSKDDVQKWNSILLAAFGASLMVGSRESNSIIPSVNRRHHLHEANRAR